MEELQVCPPIHRLGAAGKWLRSQLLAGILHGSPILVLIQNQRRPWLDSAMHTISFLGEEEFYTLLVAIITWMMDAKLGSQLCILMALGFYVTGVCKNLLCLPRPPCPPVVALLRCNDWSLPSHHAVLSVNVPWYIWFYCNMNYELSTTKLVVLFATISLWSFCVMFSRMYLGVHSPADILTGGIIGCLLLSLWLQVDSTIDSYLAATNSSSLAVCCLVLGLLWLHPDPAPTTKILAETVCMSGVAMGSVVARVHSTKENVAALERIYGSVLTLLVCCVLRFAVGFVTLIVMKVVAQYFSKLLLSQACYVLGVPCVCIKRTSSVTYEKVHYSKAFTVLDEPPSTKRWSHDSPLNLDIAVKFISYTAMGLSAVGVAPALFNTLGI